MNHLKIGFAGTPEFSAKILERLLAADCNIACVYTQPDRPQGRGRKITPSPVKEVAIANNIPCEQPASLKKEPAKSSIKKYDLDLLIVVAYGLILPQEFLEAPKMGSINIHASLLPKWRGAAPIQRAILSGDKETGITIMQMDAGLDTGDMLLKQECEITAEDTTETLTNKLNKISQDLIIEALSKMPMQGEKQDETYASYAEKIEKSEAEIDWDDVAENIHNKIRAFNPWPVAYGKIANETVKIYNSELLGIKSNKNTGGIVEINKLGIVITTKSCNLLLTEIQFPNKKRMSGADILNFYKNQNKNKN